MKKPQCSRLTQIIAGSLLLAALLCPPPLSRPVQAAAFSVNSTEDGSDTHPGDGVCVTANAVCTLRAAIEETNATPAAGETIGFNIPGSGPHIIFVPAPGLPIVHSASIIGPNQGNNAQIYLDGEDAALTGLALQDNPGAVVNGLRIQNFTTACVHLLPGSTNITVSNNILLGCAGRAGVWVESGASGTIALYGNIIGVDPIDGVTRDANLSGVEIQIAPGGGATYLIGGSLPGQRNIISGNGNGIRVDGGSASAAVRIRGNRVGVSPAGTMPAPNQEYGILVKGSPGNVVIGGAAPGEGNQIAANGSAGIAIDQSAGTVVAGNWMSTSASGGGFIANPYVSGSLDISVADSQDITIGGDTTEEGNVILQGLVFKAAGQNGVTLSRVGHNRVGLDALGVEHAGGPGSVGLRFSAASDAFIWANQVTGFETGILVEGASTAALSRNEVWNNAGLGIDLLGPVPGVTPNDPLDGDSGPNGLQNFPLFQQVNAHEDGAERKLDVHGVIQTTPNTGLRIEVFGSAACDASGYGEGQAFLAAVEVTSGADGAAAWTIADIPAQNAGDCLSAAATALDAAAGAGLGRTSEFSPWKLADPLRVYLPLISR